MPNSTFVIAGDTLIQVSHIVEVDMTHLTKGFITITTKENSYIAYGIDAIEIVYLLKPSAMEGKRLRWTRNAWAFHNFIGHPVLQILVWLGFKRQGIAFHDWSTPKPENWV